MKEAMIRINTWLSSFLDSPNKVGVLVAHNGNTTDFQYLACGFIRSGVTLNPDISFTLDTLHSMRRFKSCAYYTATTEDWTVFTPKGKRSLCIDACVTYKLSQSNSDDTFETVCGDHHDPAADTKGVMLVLWDYQVFGKKV